MSICSKPKIVMKVKYNLRPFNMYNIDNIYRTSITPLFN